MSLSYSECGVSVDRNESWISKLRNLDVTDGGFASLWEEEDTVWVSSTDGIGSKLILAKECQFKNYLRHLGNDLVAMVVNDIISSGAKPLFLLDYLAVHSIDDSDLSELIKGIRDFSKAIGCFLIGGETAELPDLIPKGLFDIAGFGVGKIDKANLWSIDRVRKGDVILGLESSGPHSNGFSLIRKIHEIDPFSEDELKKILAPTFIYSSVVLKLQKTFSNHIRVAANITGGGLLGNLSRVIPDYLNYQITIPPLPSLFKTIQKKGGVEESELRKTLNCGIGFCLIIDPFVVDEVKAICQSFYDTKIIGKILGAEVQKE